MSDNACETARHHNACETARHHEMAADCTNERHNRCARCGRCYTCGAEQTRDAGDALARNVNEWERDNPKAYGREDGA